MTTFCTTCGSVLAPDVRFCPQCGTPIVFDNSGTAASSPYDYTVPVAPLNAPSQTPSTDYSSNPYGVSLQNPYEPVSPYQTPLPPLPPPPPPPSRRPKLGLLIGIVVLVLIIASAGIVALLASRTRNTSAGNTSTPTATQAPTSIPATSIANAGKNPYSPYTGTLALNDPLTNNSKGFGWNEGTLPDGSYCKFIRGAYQANQANANYIHPCFALNTNFSNFTYELKMTILKGGCGGLIFRADSANSRYYVFDVCQDGTFSLFYFLGFGQSGTYVLNPQSSPTINPGLNQSNLVAIVANKNAFDLYVNSQKVGSAVNDTFSHGEIGVIADPNNNYPTDVMYSNAKVWTLP